MATPLTQISAPTSDLPGFILERTARRMKQFFQERLVETKADITVDQWVVLQLLDQRKAMSQLDIAKATFKDAPTVTRILDLLCKKDLTVRIPAPDDRRRFQVELTDAGRSKINAVMPTIQSARQQAWQGLDSHQMDHLMHTLNTLFNNISQPNDF